MAAIHACYAEAMASFHWFDCKMATRLVLSE